MRSRVLSSALLTLATFSALATAFAADTVPPAEELTLRLQADAQYAARDSACLATYRRLAAMYPEDGELAVRLARALSYMGRREEALVWGRKALDLGFAYEPAACYSQAARAARAGRTEDAIAWLERSLAAGLEERGQLADDGAFESLHGDARFRWMAGMAPEGELSREEGWRYDIDFFADEARRIHPDPRRPARTPGFERAVQSLQDRVPDLDDVAVAMELQKIVAQHLADGHSALYPTPTPRVQFGLLPVDYYFFEDGLFLIWADEGYEHLVGREVVAFNGKPLAGLRDSLETIVSHDNGTGMLWLAPLYLRFPAVLRAIGYGERLDGAALTLRDGTGSEETVELAAGPGQPGPALPPSPNAPEAAVWLARAGETYWSESWPDADAVYAQINQIRNAEDGPDLGEFAERLRGQLASAVAQNLVLDVRLNNGGNNGLVGPLVRLAVWHEMAEPGNRVFVLTGRNTFSACQNLVNRLERMTSAIFVGEPAGSKPNVAGESNGIRLPWSGIRMNVSSRWWQDSDPTDHRPYVPVAMHVAYTARDWWEGRDPVREALGAYLRPR